MVSAHNFDMDVLRTFVTGVRFGSFARAAEALGSPIVAIRLEPGIRWGRPPRLGSARSAADLFSGGFESEPRVPRFRSRGAVLEGLGAPCGADPRPETRRDLEGWGDGEIRCTLLIRDIGLSPSNPFP